MHLNNLNRVKFVAMTQPSAGEQKQISQGLVAMASGSTSNPELGMGASNMGPINPCCT